MKTTTLALVLALAVLATSAGALEQEGNLRFIVADPNGDFGRAVDQAGFGLAAQYGLRPQPSLTIGAGVDFLIYGSRSTHHDLPLVDDFKLTTDNNLGGGFLFARWRPLSGVVQPYAEVRAGMNYLWTDSKLEDDDGWDDGEIARETNFDDFAPFWSGGGGLLIRLSQGNQFERKPGVFLDLAVAYQQGGEAEYLTEGDITLEAGRPVFATSRSTTDLTTFELGVGFTF